MIELGIGEYIVYTARKHSFVFFSETAFILILALSPLIPLSNISSIASAVRLAGIEPVYFFWYLYILWATALWLVFIYVWTDYYLDVWMVTNKHILDVEQHGLFNRKISTSRLDLIQDVTVEVPSVWATLFKYGNIHLQTAGKEKEFIFENVAKPYQLREAIMKEHDRVMEARRETDTPRTE